MQRIRAELRTGPVAARVVLPGGSRVDEILRRGRLVAEFRGDVEAPDVHLLISSYCGFHGANRGFWSDVALAEASPGAHLRGCTAT